MTEPASHESAPTPGQPATVRAVDRALDILLCFSKADGGLTLSDIARQVNLHKSTVYRLLMSLQVKGFVRKASDSDRYLLGWSVLELLSSLHQSDQLSALALPEMTRLRDAIGETVSLYVRSALERVRIQSVESRQPVRNVGTIGRRYPLYIGASGKVLLAFADSSVRDAVSSSEVLPEDLDRSEFLAQLDAIRQDGYAVSIQERDVSAAALSVPVFGRDQHIAAALSVSGPVSRFTPERMRDSVELVRGAASFITKLLSH
ncbi:IclR family transcriptional regulator [Alicyclobacillus sp. ALC3]|uniref:IclR family transcriptional regulator n=1 Tax=Alicyclobacillus sp. ALC3 TaxID=2796143 RepID=UPI002378D989|nr:IclR family transcriptional regulator [Alicyclobacillus sp. ALC3]WDL98658.1 IclR family transcriptional regulator [Alicyclobacillus sp. ALC3]